MAGSVVLFPSYYAAYCPYLRHLKRGHEIQEHTAREQKGITFDLKHNVLRWFEARENVTCFC
jgi:hypothetical protein